VIEDRPHGNRGGPREGKTECPGADCGKRDRPDPVFLREPEGAGVAGSEQGVLAVIATSPPGTDSVDDEPGGEVVTSRDLRFTRLTATEPPALFEEAGTRGPVDRPVDASSAKEALVRGIDDGIDTLQGYVAFRDDDPVSEQSSHVSGIWTPPQ